MSVPHAGCEHGQRIGLLADTPLWSSASVERSDGPTVLGERPPAGPLISNPLSACVLIVLAAGAKPRTHQAMPVDTKERLLLPIFELRQMRDEAAVREEALTVRRLGSAIARTETELGELRWRGDDDVPASA